MRKIFTVVLLTILGTASSLLAQESIVASGGEANGTGGSSSYTLGQVVYTTNAGANGSLAQGVQQPYEISVVTSIAEAQGISLEVSVYPNPTTDYLTLSISNNVQTNRDQSLISYQVQTSRDWSLISYQLYNIDGKLLQSKKATGNQTEIPTSQLAPATYFVKVLDSKKEIKNFKIIKK